jgi:hypothetical protein
MKHCTFPGCQSPVVANGLCAKHNMRLRRHGDPAHVGRPGRKDKDPMRAMVYEVMRPTNMSERSFARYWRGLKLLRAFGLDPAPVIKKCTRPSGSMNWAQFEEIAESMAAACLAGPLP